MHRNQTKSSMAIDNIFIDISKKEEYRICSLINGLSDHDAQFIIIHNTVPYLQINNILTIRKFNENSTYEFKIKLSL
jgi:ribosomal protein L22